jgi:transcriptional regulator with XRE-family HTH domain
MYERIMEELKRMGFKSVRELERQADVSYGTVRNIKYGHMPPSDKLYRIADILGVSVNYLLTGEKDWDPLGDEPDPTPPEVYRKRRMVLSLIDDLSEENYKIAIDYLQYLRAKEEKK